MNIEEKRQQFRDKEKLLVDTFIELEYLEYTKNIDVEKIKNEVWEFINTNGVNYITLESLTNLGQASRSLTIDRFDSSRYSEGDITITFCPCGNCWSATQKFIDFEEKNEKGLFGKVTIKVLKKGH